VEKKYNILQSAPREPPYGKVLPHCYIHPRNRTAPYLRKWKAKELSSYHICCAAEKELITDKMKKKASYSFDYR